MTTNKRFKRILALLLAAALCFSNMLSPALSAFAEEYSGGGTNGNRYVLILSDSTYGTDEISENSNVTVSTGNGTNTSNAGASTSNSSSDVIRYSVSGSKITVTAVKTGNAAIQYTYKDGSQTRTKTVYYTVVSATYETINLTVGATTTIEISGFNDDDDAEDAGDDLVATNATTKKNNNPSEAVYYSTTDSKVSDKNYKLVIIVEGLNVGTATFTVEDADGNLKFYTINVTQATTDITLTYDANGGSVTPASETITVNSGANATFTLPTPTRTGWTFTGWELENESVLAVSTTTYETGSSETLTATWSQDKYTVTFYDEDGNNAVASTSNLVYGNTVTAPAVDEKTDTETTDYTFAGWATTAGGSVVLADKAELTVTGDATYYAVYSSQAVKYNVSYTDTTDDSTVAGLPGTESVANGSSYTIASTEPTRTGYTFSHWVASAGVSGNYKYSSSDYNSSFTMPTSAVTLTAVWDINTYNVSFAYADATVAANAEATLTGTTADYKDYVAESSVPAPDSEVVTTEKTYTFVGWSTNQNATASDNLLNASGIAAMAVTDHVTYYAIYSEAATQYTVTYVNGNIALASGSSVPDAETVDYGTEITVEALLVPASSNYSAEGWSYNGTTYAAGDPITVTGDVTLQAEWASLYTVTYDDGVADENIEMPSNDYYYASGAKVIVSRTIPTRTGYTFAGWEINGVTYSNKIGETFEYSMPEGGLTITATWTPNEYTVTYYHDHAYEYDVLENNGEGAFAVDYAATSTDRNTSHGVVTTITPGYYTYTSNDANVFAEYFYNEQIVTYGSKIDASVISTASVTAKANESINSSLQSSTYVFGSYWTVYEEDDTSYTVTDLSTVTVDQDLIIVSNFEATSANFTYTNDEGTTNTVNFNGEFFTRDSITVIDYYEEIGDTTTHYDAVADENTNSASVINWEVNNGSLDFTCVNSGTAFITIESSNGIETFSITVQKSYTVDYVYVGGTAPEDTTAYHEADTVEIEYPTTPDAKDGYTFAWGVSVTDSNSNPVTVDEDGTFTMPGADVTVTFTEDWTPITYDITYELNGGDYAVGVSNPSTYTVEDEITLKTLSKTGYTFGGWYDNATFAGEAITKISNDSTGDKTFYAKWTINTYEVTFDSNGGSDVDAQDVEYLGTATEPTAPTKYGYVFDGWYAADSETAFDFETEITEEITLTAKWLPTYIVAYADGVTDETITMPWGARYLENTEITLADAPEYEGYIFLGWSDGEELHAAGADYTTSAAHVTFTAQWAKASVEEPSETDDAYELYSDGGVYNGVYDAAEHALINGLSVVDGNNNDLVEGTDYNVSYSVVYTGMQDDAQPVSSSPEGIPTGTDAGTYEITVTVTVGGEEIMSEILTATIEQAPLTITVEDADKTADESDPSYSASVVGLVSTSHGVSFYLSREAGDAVGTYEITAFGAIVKAFSTNELDETTFVDVTANYEINYVSGILTINAAPVVEEDDDDDTTTTTTTTTTTPTVTEVVIEPEVVEVTPAVATTPTTEEPEAQVEEAPVEIEETEVPLASAEDEGSTEIEDTEVPLVATATTTGWALLNLILAIGTVATSIIMLVSYFLNRRDDEEAASGNENLKVLSVLPAAIAAAFFMLTSDMSSAMSFVDKWTLAMALIAIIQLAIVVVSGKGKNTTTGDEFV